MTETAEEIEIFLEGATTAPETPEIVEAPKKNDVDLGIEDLRRQLDAEKAQAAAAIQAAEARATEAQRKATGFQNEAQQAQYDAVSRALEAQNGVIAAAEADYAAALDAGDHARAAKAQTAIAKATHIQSRLEDGKSQMEAMRANAARQPVQQQRQAVPQSQFTPRTQAWLNAHPDVLTNPVKNAEVQLAHAKAVDAGFVPDSDAYFDFVETQAGYKAAAPTRQNQRQAAPSAPPAQSSRAPSGKAAPTKLVMTPRMQEAARTAGISPQEWGKQYLIALAKDEIEPLN
jgi:hypothetical protein